MFELLVTAKQSMINKEVYPFPQGFAGSNPTRSTFAYFLLVSCFLAKKKQRQYPLWLEFEPLSQ